MYNATVYQTRNMNGENVRYGIFTADVREIDGKLQMIRSNFIQCTGYEGKVAPFNSGTDLAAKYPGENALYHVYMLESHPESSFEIVMDDCKGYMQAFSQMDLPPIYFSAK